MIGVYGSLAVTLVAALVVGVALDAFARGGRAGGGPSAWLAAGYGLAAVLVVAGAAARLPGDDVTAGIAIAVVVALAAAYLARTGAGLEDWLRVGIPVAVIAMLAVSIPYALAGRPGILGVGLINDDMASHLLIADWVRDPSADPPVFVRGGYPTGPHALVAGIAALSGAGLVDVFSGFTLALAPLTGLGVLAFLGDLGPVRRTLAASLAALAYLGAAYLTQGAFKEPLQAILLLAFAGGLWQLVSAWPDPGGPHPARRVLPLAVLAAASVFTYSLPGLVWIAAVACAVLAAWLAPRVIAAHDNGESWRAALPEGAGRAARPYLLAAAAVLIVFTAQEWSRIADFARIDAFNPDRFGSDLGNLRGSLSPLEAFGVWPAGDYRTAAGDSSAPALVFWAGAALALGFTVAGAVRMWRAGRVAVPSVLAATALIWAGSALLSTPYIAAKALAIAAPVAMAAAAAAALAPGGSSVRRLAGGVFVLLAAASSFLVLRQAPVGPEAHARELDRIRPLVEGADVLFLGRDDFIAWHLRGAGEVAGIVTNHYDVEEVKGRFRKTRGGGEKFDIDAAHPSTLDRFDYVLTTTGGPQSQASNLFKEVQRTPSYVLYSLPGTAGKRRTLDEGTEPGAVLDCSTRLGREIATGKGTALVWRTPPVIAGEADWEPGATIENSAATSELDLTRGRWLISLSYDSRRPIEVRSRRLGLDSRLPANLDFRGPSPYLPVGEVEVARPGRYAFSVSTTEPNWLAEAVRAPNEAHLRRLSATPLFGIERIQRRDACGSYVDWYRPKGESGLRTGSLQPGG